MFNDLKLYKIHALAEDGLEKDIEKVRKNPNVTLVSLPSNIPIKSRTTSPEILLPAYNAGIEEGNKVLANLNL